MTNHTHCTHTATPKGRAICRKGNAIVEGVTVGDMVQVDGCGWFVITRVVILNDFPHEIEIRRESVTIGWVEAWTVTGHDKRP
jgi:hypothetical protein